MRQVTLKLSLQELSKLTGVPARKLHAQMRKAKVDPDNTLAVLLWMHPRIVMQCQDGMNIKQAWKELRDARDEDSQRRRDALVKRKNTHIMTANGPVYSVAVRDEYAQESPEY
jgi:hypothetical protein